jgi:hypothetical protein
MTGMSDFKDGENFILTIYVIFTQTSVLDGNKMEEDEINRPYSTNGEQRRENKQHLLSLN